MYIERVPNRNSPPAVLLRKSLRVGDKVKKVTLANLSELRDDQIDAIADILRGKQAPVTGGPLAITRSLPHGHVEAVTLMMSRLGLDRLLSSRPCRERSLVCAMIVQRVLNPTSKLATVRQWGQSTVAESFGVGDAHVNEAYAALDWLLARQDQVQRKLAARHLAEGGHALFDLSSSYYEGSTCPLAKRGYSRDQKKGSLQINFGLLGNAEGCPVAISVYPGNVADAATLLPQVKSLRDDFKLSQVVLVGDRGMVTEKHIASLRELEGMRWITALRSVSIRKLVENDGLQLDLFDERNLFAFEHASYPGERLVACRNPALQQKRQKVRESLLEATCRDLDALVARVDAGRLVGASRIGVAAGRIVNRHKVAKHVVLDIQDRRLCYRIDEDSVAMEGAVDGIYVIRTSVPGESLDAEAVVRAYKALTHIERDFRSMKTMDLHVRPVFHASEDRVRAHFFLCFLARYVMWHLERAWASLTFTDEMPEPTPDPVVPREVSASAAAKANTRLTTHGHTVHSVRTLLTELATVVRNTATVASGPGATASFCIDTERTPLQSLAQGLVRNYRL